MYSLQYAWCVNVCRVTPNVTTVSLLFILYLPEFKLVCSIAQLAAPSPAVLATLEALCEDPANVVYVISGRRKVSFQGISMHYTVTACTVSQVLAS